METKMITIPFEVELAKEIQAGTKPGKIVTRGGKNVRVVCWDMNAENPILVLIKNENDREDVCQYPQSGKFYLNGIEYNLDLMLQVPEWTQFKDGDVLACEVDNGGGNFCKWYSVLKGMIGDDFSRPYITSYVDYNYDSSYRAGELIYDDTANNIDSIRLATEEEKQKLIKRLQEEDTTKAKDILKRFFGIEEKQECEFEPFQQVLVRDDCKRRWICALFNFYDRRKETSYPFVCIGGPFRYCIPYNDQTKHLLGTTDNWEAQQ